MAEPALSSAEGSLGGLFCFLRQSVNETVFVKLETRVPGTVEGGGRQYGRENEMENCLQRPLKNPEPELFTTAQWERLAKYFHLTSRQREIARLICGSKTGKQIAARLRISVNTVRLHRRMLFRKLSVHDRVALVVRLVVVGRMLRLNQ